MNDASNTKGTLSLETNTHKGVRCVPEKESKAVAEQRGRERKKKKKGRAEGERGDNNKKSQRGEQKGQARPRS